MPGCDPHSWHSQGERSGAGDERQDVTTIVGPAYSAIALTALCIANKLNAKSEDPLPQHGSRSTREALWEKTKGGDALAVDRILSTMERRARLLGLDASAKQEISSEGGGLLVIARREKEEG